METSTIIQIKEYKDKIKTGLDTWKTSLKSRNIDMNIAQYGAENEYSINGLIDGIKNILTDVSYLVNAHEQFIKISTQSERTSLLANLKNLYAAIGSQQTHTIATRVDEIKISLRKYNLRFHKGRYVEFEDEIDNLRKLATSLEDDIKGVKDKIQDSQLTHSEIVSEKEKYDLELAELTEKKNALINAITEFEKAQNRINTLSTQAEESSTNINKKQESIEASESTINEFVKEIKSRSKELEEQSAQTKAYEQKLNEFTNRHNSSLSDAESLIKSAREALRYSTAKGMSEAFQTQYNAAKNGWVIFGWISGAIIFVILTIAIGVWIVVGSEQSTSANGINITSLISRISMIPLTLTGAMFCARQYVKQKNIIEDYAYKTVLTKSIVAFSEEFKGKEQYSQYIETVLREIHQDPLRQRVKDKEKDKDEVDLKGVIGLLEKTIELAKGLSK